jgi:phosphatidylglycerophosphatase A
MPGTYGSVLGVGLYVGLASVSLRLAHPRTFLALATIVIAGASIAVVAAALKAFRADDPAQIVLDEVAGQWITLLPLAMTPEGKSSGWAGIALGFLLFRAFDTLKPYPIQKLEKLPGAWGVVADDLGAGVAAGLLLAAASRWWGIL